MFEIKECKTKAGYTVKPLKKTKVDFAKIRKSFQVVFDSPLVLVIQEEGMEIVIHIYGELLIKNTKDKEKMQSIARRIYA